MSVMGVLSVQAPRISERELNPHWKGGDGTGLPTTEAGRAVGRGGVGDGGASWRRKALKRAHEEAAREGTDVKEVGHIGH